MNRLHITKTYFLLLLAGMGMLWSCNKKEFLDKKPSSDLVVPTTLVDFQALLDNDIVMQETPELGELSSDNFYLLPDFWQGLPLKEQNAYIWAMDIYGGQGNVDDWDLPYQQVFYANVVLEGLANVKIDSSNMQQWNRLKGSALFIRSYAFYNVAQLFAPVYDSNDAPGDRFGIPLRLSSDVNVVSTRSTVQETYDRILNDLQEASSLLAAPLPSPYLNRPSKPAVLAMLARVYLSMRKYDQAGLYADSCLKSYGSLVDYNSLDTTAIFPFNTSKSEVLYQSHMLSSSDVLVGFVDTGCIVDSGLYQSYASTDLRRGIFYTGSPKPNIKGSYNLSLFAFTGLATDEMYLIRAECSARAGNTIAALNDLDSLLRYRWVTGSFVPYTPATMTQAQVLNTILTERRKELAFRGIRWTDLRRLNKDSANIALNRFINMASYQLPPNDPRYILPIPPDVITLSGIAQNPR